MDAQPLETQKDVVVWVTPHPKKFRTEDGQIVRAPAGWALLPPGDAGLTRRVKAAGPSWTIKEPWKRRVRSRGVLAPPDQIEACRATLERERGTETYQKRRASDAARREKQQAAYVEDFGAAVRDFLGFAPVHAALADRLVEAVTAHATPVGSGTVARTQRIPIERRAEAAVIAWMRHQTTAYDDMRIARIKGERREVRRMLAKRSRTILGRYRAGQPAAPGCPLAAALERTDAAERAR